MPVTPSCRHPVPRHLIPLAAALMLVASPALGAGVGTSSTGAGADPSGVGASTMGMSTGTNVIANNNVNVETNIDASRNISVTKTFNGVDVSYGLAGATVLNNINDARSYAQGISDQRNAAAQQAADTAAYVAQFGRALMAQ